MARRNWGRRFTRGLRASRVRSPVKDIIRLDSPYRFWAVQASNASGTRLSLLPAWLSACVHAHRGRARVFQTPLVTHASLPRVCVRACRVGARRATVLRVCIARTNRATLRTHYMRAYTLPRWLGSAATTRIPHNFFDVLVSIVIKPRLLFTRNFPAVKNLFDFFQICHSFFFQFYYWNITREYFNCDNSFLVLYICVM